MPGAIGDGAAMTTVVDASAYLVLLLDQLARDDRRRFDTDLAAPDLLLVEVAAGLARSVRRGVVTGVRADLLLDRTLIAPLDITPTSKLVDRAFELRANVTVYDACYVALAEQLDCELLTADRRLAGAPGLTVPVTVI
jgi:predicted nucleic acid-binding protein